MTDTARPYPSIGTSSPIFIPSDFSAEPIRVGRDYFAIRICGAQVAFVGSIWSRVKSLLVSTQVNLHHSALGERSFRSLQHTRSVRDRVDEQLGLAVNLVNLTPAVMSQVTLSIDFHLDKENHIAKLGSLVNKESFATALSLAPGIAAVAKTISALADDVIQTFISPQEQEPVLRFTGDFNLSTGQLMPGYYAILGSRDLGHPIPAEMPRLAVKDNRLFSEGQPMSGLSYVIIEVRKTAVRSRDLGVGSEWDVRLREAEDIAQGLLDDPLADDEGRRSAWEKCRNLIKEAQTFLRAEPNFLRSEAELIVKAAYLRCRELVTEPVLERHLSFSNAEAKTVWLPDDLEDRRSLDIGADGALEPDVLRYAEDVAKSRDSLANWVSNA